MIGQAISHYTIIEKLGEGGMGVVYKAHDKNLDRLVALKFLPPHVASSEDERVRFMTEARAAAALNHPNIGQVYTIEEADQQVFIVMELIEGFELKQKIQEGPLPLDEVLRITREIAGGLQAAHESGIIHRDIKSSNIMLTGVGLVKIMDFGLAKVEGRPQVTKIGTTVGTVAYMSPEQARGDEVDHKTDIWSMGVLAYEMLAGRLPFRSDYEQAVIYSILNEDPVSLSAVRPEIPTPVSDAIRKALSKDPGARYSSATDFQSDLETAGRMESKEGGAPVPVSRPGKKIVWPKIVVPIIILAAMAAVFLIFGSGETYDSLAILPFENVGGDESTEYLSDGMTESLISTLSGLPDLRVMSRNSVFRYKGDVEDPKGIGEQLGVGAVLSGRIQTRGNSLTVSTELIDVSDNSQIWGAQYIRPATDLLVLQEEITREISENLRLRFGENAAGVQQPTRNSEAYQLYLKGRYFWNKRNEDGTRKAIGYFNQAVETDPGFSVAYAGLADAYIILGGYNTVAPVDAFPAARAAAEKALEINPSLAEAHASLGDIEIHYGWDWAKAGRELSRAIQLDSTYATAYQWYGEYLGAVGRHREAIAITTRGRDLDPLAPIISTYVGLAYFVARDLVSAKAEFERTIALTPDFPWTRLYYGQCLGAMGLKDEMVQEIEAARNLYDHPMILAYLGYAYGIAGRRPEAEAILSNLVRSGGEGYVSPYYLAVVQLGLGRLAETLSSLEQGVEDRSPTMFFLGVHPMWDSLRDEPRFVAILEHIGLSDVLPREKWAVK